MEHATLVYGNKKQKNKNKTSYACRFSSIVCQTKHKLISVAIRGSDSKAVKAQ